MVRLKMVNKYSYALFCFKVLSESLAYNAIRTKLKANPKQSKLNLGMGKVNKMLNFYLLSEESENKEQDMSLP